MDFSLTEEQRELQTIARTFARERVRPRTRELDRVTDPAAAWPGDLFREASRLGLRTFSLPREFGGRGAGLITELVVLEELCVGDVAFGSSLAHPWREGKVLAIETTPDQRERFLKPYLADDDGMTALGITEPHAGSDNSSGFDGTLEAGPQTTAVRDGDGWVLNGRKTFITAGNVARFMIVIARTNRGVPWRQGISLFIVPTDTPGYRCVRVMDKLGLRPNPNTEVTFENCWVPAISLLGEVNGGMALLARFAAGSRVKEGVKALGAARAAYEEAVTWTRNRVQGGRSMIGHQAIAHKLVEMAAEIESVRSICWRAAWTISQDPEAGFRLETMAKIKATEMAARVAVAALEMFGGYGVLKEHPIEKIARDAITMLHTTGGNDGLRSGLARLMYEDAESLEHEARP